MKTYLSSAQVADQLGVSRDALNAKIRSGEFVDPDVIIGDRFQGWSAETVERVRREAVDNHILCVPDGAAELVTSIRQVAEYLRGYGNSATDPAKGIHRLVPAALHAIAARMENEVRMLIVSDHTLGRRVGAIIDSEPELHDETEVPLPFGTVPSIISPVSTDNATRAAMLRECANRLSAVMIQMAGVLNTAVARQAKGALGAEYDKILAYAAELDAELPA